jgi:ADP-L-glycero-D-manno-heptose 6-epimerase
MIVITGAAGFIGSCLLNKLNNKGFRDIVIVDDFSREDKNRNIANKVFLKKLDRMVFIEWLKQHHHQVSFVFHLGARTDTTETNKTIFDKLNLNYSKSVWEACTRYNIPLIYASSAATYGAGEHGYDDDHAQLDKLKPLNPYGESKHNFDKWVLAQKHKPGFWAGLKFFNVYGPNEYHKGRMASVVFHTFNKIRGEGKMELFRSHKPEYRDGEQQRDFIYVKDVVDVCYFMMLHPSQSGIFNLGTGQARSFLDLASATFDAMEKKKEISFIDTPEDIRENYQYFTRAPMEKLLETGYSRPFYSLEEGVRDYVQGYLLPGNYY